MVACVTHASALPCAQPEPGGGQNPNSQNAKNPGTGVFLSLCPERHWKLSYLLVRGCIMYNICQQVKLDPGAEIPMTTASCLGFLVALTVLLTYL